MFAHMCVWVKKCLPIYVCNIRKKLQNLTPTPYAAIRKIEKGKEGEGEGRKKGKNNLMGKKAKQRYGNIKTGKKGKKGDKHSKIRKGEAAKRKKESKPTN